MNSENFKGPERAAIAQLTQGVRSSLASDVLKFFAPQFALGATKAGLILVTAFPNRRSMASFVAQIAWRTEAWCADEPTHLIHFNGDRFLGPH